MYQLDHHRDGHARVRRDVHMPVTRHDGSGDMTVHGRGGHAVITTCGRTPAHVARGRLAVDA